MTQADGAGARVLLVTEEWQRVVEVAEATEIIDAEGMTWRRDPSSGAQAPRYVPLVSG